MGRFQATEGIDIKGNASVTGSLAVTGTSTIPSIIGGTTITGNTFLSGSTFLGPSAATYMSQVDWQNLAGTVLGTTAGGQLGFMYPFTIFSGGQWRLLNQGNNYVGDNLNPWTVMNGGLFTFYPTNTSQTLIIDAGTMGSQGLTYGSFTFMTMGSDIIDLKVQAGTYTGTTWEVRLDGSRSTTNYAYTSTKSVASNALVTLDFAPQSTSITHVIVDSVQRRMGIHCTNLG